LEAQNGAASASKDQLEDEAEDLDEQKDILGPLHFLAVFEDDVGRQSPDPSGRAS